MKNLFLSIVFFLVLISCYSNDNKKVNLLPLTQKEINDLKYLREEEKLARDIYLFSYDKYQIRIFDNISQSEQTHMDRVLNLLEKYGISDPASTKRGVFQNQELQKLYNSLTDKSAVSLIEALKTGATIEDLDINDIDHFIKNTTKSDLLNVYDNLTCGSKNHIRAYSRQLTFRDLTYFPQYISVEYYNSILNESTKGCGNK